MADSDPLDGVVSLPEIIGARSSDSQISKPSFEMIDIFLVNERSERSKAREEAMKLGRSSNGTFSPVFPYKIRARGIQFVKTKDFFEGFGVSDETNERVLKTSRKKLKREAFELTRNPSIFTKFSEQKTPSKPSKNSKLLEVYSSQVLALKEQLFELQTKLENANLESVSAQDRNEMLQNLLSLNENARVAMNEQLQKLKGNIRVFCRIKPTVDHSARCIEVPPQGDFARQLDLLSGGKRVPYYFERVFEEKSSQLEVFEEVEGFIQSAFDGNFVTIFAYGQTCSGKTHTLLGSETQPGAIPLSLKKLFAEKNARDLAGIACEISLSCLEVYNERIFDLLIESSNREVKQTSEDSSKPFHSSLVVESTDQALSILAKAQVRRSTESTAFNSSSSRSHFLFKIEIRQSGKAGRLTIVDLAGSEAASASAPASVTVEKAKKIMAEGSFINKSLTTLGRIMRMIKEQRRTGVIASIPVRETKLTRLLQESFTERALVLLFVNVCQEEANLRQTKETLKFGNLTGS